MSSNCFSIQPQLTGDVLKMDFRNFIPRCIVPTTLLSFSQTLFGGNKPFDEIPYQLDGKFDTPMNTLAGETEWARDILEVYGITTWITAAVFFAVALPVIYTVWKFRAKEGDEDKMPKQVHGNHILELIWTIVPAILLLFIAFPTWQKIFKQAAEAPKNALVVKAIGHQWWWEFEYPSLGINTANELHLPANTPIVFELESTDVIHSFWIPRLSGKVDTVPGTTNRLMFTTPSVSDANKIGGDYYQGQCAELCGWSHALMRFEAVVHSKEEFLAWSTQHNEPPKPRTRREKRGEKVFAQCSACHAISGTSYSSKIAPNLSNFGSRRYLGATTRLNTHDNLVEWIKNPDAIKPGALMTAFGETLSDDDIDAVAAYLRFATAKPLGNKQSIQ